MSGGHAHGLFVHAHSRVHRLAAAPKIVGTAGWAIVVVLVPREELWIFASLSALLAMVVATSRIRAWMFLRRLAIELPFIGFALALPFVADGEGVSLLGVSLATEGLWAAWNIFIKASLCTGAAVVLAATTQTSEILKGLERLKVPRVLISIAGYMVRYIDVVLGEAKRMLLARRARGDQGRWLWHIRSVASIAGSLFIRSFERGERVYVSMLSRGYMGSMPSLELVEIPRRDWVVCVGLPMIAAGLAAVGVAL
jgi:cobalt/nickel transport system permease protein